MGAIYSQTPNIGLDLYGDKDPADLRDGHNANMVKIDETIKQQADAIALKADSANVYDKNAIDQKTTALQSSIDQKTTALQSSIDTKESKEDATNSHNALSSLINSKADQIETNLSQVKTRSDLSAEILDAIGATSLENSGNIYHERWVMFGDSWCQWPLVDNVEGNYTFSLQKAINDISGWNFYGNFGVGGSLLSDVRGQVESAKAKLNLASRQLVNKIVVVNGINSMNALSDFGAASSQARDAGDAIRTAFPNAKIYWFPSSSKNATRGGLSMVNAIAAGYRKSGVAVFPQFFTYFWNSATDMWHPNGGGMHLSAAGYQKYAELIVSAITGGQPIGGSYSVGGTISRNDFQFSKASTVQLAPGSKFEDALWVNSATMRQDGMLDVEMAINPSAVTIGDHNGKCVIDIRDTSPLYDLNNHQKCFGGSISEAVGPVLFQHGGGQVIAVMRTDSMKDNNISWMFSIPLYKEVV